MRMKASISAAGGDNILPKILGILGVAAGIASFTVAVGLALGMDLLVDRVPAGSGWKYLILSLRPDTDPHGSPGRPFSPGDARAIAGIPGINLVSCCRVDLRATVSRGQTPIQADVVGTDTAFARIRNRRTGAGRFLTGFDVENRRRVCVVTGAVCGLLFPGGDGVGETLEINGVSFTIVGCLEPMVQPVRTLAGREEGDVFIPITTSQSLQGDYGFDLLYLRYDRSCEKSRDLKALKSRIAGILARRKGWGFSFELNDPADAIKALRLSALSKSIVLGVFAGLCLALAAVLGGNGAWDGLRRLQAETVRLTVIGVLGGLIFGAIAARLVEKHTGLPIDLGWWLPAAGAVLVVLYGLALILNPAGHAAGLGGEHARE